MVQKFSSLQANVETSLSDGYTGKTLHISSKAFVYSSVLYKIHDYTKNYPNSTIFYTDYMLYEDAITIRVLRRIVFQFFASILP